MLRWLGQPGSGFTLSKRDVRAVNIAVSSDVGPEVRLAHRLAGLRFGLSDIGRIDDAIGGGVADEHVHARIDGAKDSVAGVMRVAQPNDQLLRAGHTGEVDRDLVWLRPHGRGGGGGGALSGAGVARARDRSIECVNQGVTSIRARVSAFDSGGAIDRQRNVEVTGGAMALSRNDARNWYLAGGGALDVNEAEAVERRITGADFVR